MANTGRASAKKKAKRARTKPSKRKPAKKAASARSRSKASAKASVVGIRTLHVDFMTYKVEQMRKFYGELLELKTQTQDVEGLSYLVVSPSPSATLGFMPPHPERLGEISSPREATLYFLVNDVDRTYRRLSEKGVGFAGPPEEMPWGHRVIVTTDPEGRTVMLGGKAVKEK